MGYRLAGAERAAIMPLASMHQDVSCSIRKICVDALFKAQNT
jgi:hypothetical protein